MEPLTEREVNEIQKSLTDEQKEFLNEHLKRSKKSKWLEILSRKKGITLSKEMTEDEVEEELDSWVLKEVLDGGFGNKPYRCECGNPLRYQYIVFHTKEKKTYKLGETCLEHYTNLSPEIISDIKKGLHTIDLERDEILIKYRNHKFFLLDKLRYIENLPEEIVKQVEIGLPLTDRQIEKIYRIKQEYDQEVQFKKVYNGFNEKQRSVFDHLAPRKREEVIEKIIDDRFFEGDIPDDFHNEEIEKFVEVGFPLLKEHLLKLSELKKMKKTYVLHRNHVVAEAIISKMTYDELIKRHLDTLRKVREKEEMIPRGLKKDWEQIQQMVLTLKTKEEFSYDSFKLLLRNLLYALRIDPDSYL